VKGEELGAGIGLVTSWEEKKRRHRTVEERAAENRGALEDPQTPARAKGGRIARKSNLDKSAQTYPLPNGKQDSKHRRITENLTKWGHPI